MKNSSLFLFTNNFFDENTWVITHRYCFLLFVLFLTLVLLRGPNLTVLRAIPFNYILILSFLAGLFLFILFFKIMFSAVCVRISYSSYSFHVDSRAHLGHF